MMICLKLSRLFPMKSRPCPRIFQVNFFWFFPGTEWQVSRPVFVLKVFETAIFRISLRPFSCTISSFRLFGNYLSRSGRSADVRPQNQSHFWPFFDTTRVRVRSTAVYGQGYEKKTASSNAIGCREDGRRAVVSVRNFPRCLRCG